LAGPPRSSLATDRQTGAGVQARPTARAREDARSRRSQGTGLAAERLGVVELGKAKIVPIVGLNYKDEPAAGMRWLTQNGDPYNLSVVDRDGRVGIDWGVYGVPETFVIDKEGAIRYKQIGPITAEALQSKIMPLVRELQKS
jgi:cytochrome c biogenesis protein CcmG/thiol:disulfide interchange protein DsbE